MRFWKWSKRRRHDQSTTPILYKYLGPERVSVLSTWRVRFSHVAALNDPFEFATTLGPGSLHEAAQRQARRVSNPLGLMSMGFAQAIKLVKSDSRAATLPRLIQLLIIAVACLFVPPLCIAAYPFISIHARESMAAVAADMEDIFPQLRNGLLLVFSTSESWSSVPMWAHYASNHTGFVLGINPEQSFGANARDGEPKYLKPKKVIYSAKTPSFRPGTFDIDDFLSCKMDHWSYEQEWRFLNFPDDASTSGIDNSGIDLFLFDINPGSVTEIIFGAACSNQTMIDALRALLLHGHSAKVFKICHDTTYGFRRVPLSDFLSSDTQAQPITATSKLRDLRMDRFEDSLKRMTDAAKNHSFFGPSKRPDL